MAFAKGDRCLRLWSVGYFMITKIVNGSSSNFTSYSLRGILAPIQRGVEQSWHMEMARSSH